MQTTNPSKLPILQHKRGNMKRRTPVHALLDRELLGMCPRKVFPSVPDRFRVDFLSLKCGSQIVLGFTANGTQLLGYSITEPTVDAAPIICLSAWDVDFSRCEASSESFTLEIPGMLKSESLGEMLIPLQVIQAHEKLLIVTRYNQRYERFAEVENIICIMDENDWRFGDAVSIKYGMHVDPEQTVIPLLPTPFHVHCSNSSLAVAFDMGQYIRVLFMDTKQIPSTPSAAWWKRRDQDCDKFPEGVAFRSSRKDNRLSRKGHIACRTLDAEGFAVETLEKQLNAKLVLLSNFMETPSEGCFALLDYAIKFVRFTSISCFEFVVVSNVRSVEGDMYVAFVCQISLQGHRLLHVMKSMTSEGNAETRCARLVRTRLRGFRVPADVFVADNAPVIEGKPLMSVSNPTLPFEIVWGG